MLKEQYKLLKLEYKNYILLLKSGNFYICLNNDAYIMNNIFNFKIVNSTNFIKVGFPISSLNKIVTKLNQLEINYIIFDENIIEKEKYKNNHYDKYLDVNNYFVNFNRINKINDILKNSINNPNLNDILTSIERILCKIDF